MKVGLLLLLIGIVGSPIFAQVQPKVEVRTIKGEVIAETADPVISAICWHVCGMHLIIRTREKDAEKLVLVDIEFFDNHSLPRNGMPMELLKSGKRWKFKGIWEDAQPLNEFLNVIENGKDVSREAGWRAWNILPEFQDIKLPYGEKLPQFRVRLQDKFKEIR